MSFTPSPIFSIGADASSPLADVSGVKPPLKIKNATIRLESSTGYEITTVDDDPTLAANSKQRVCTQYAVKQFVNSGAGGITGGVYPIVTSGANLALMNSDAIVITMIDTDPFLTADFDTRIPTQRAVKAYVDNMAPAAVIYDTPLDLTAGHVRLLNSALGVMTSISTDGTFAANSNTLLSTQQAIKTYVDTRAPITVYKSPVNRNANQLRLINSLSNEITEVSTDGTMASNSDLSIPTQKAVVTYVASQAYSPLFTSVTNPLYINLNSLKIYDAALFQAGIVSTGSQTFAGSKSFAMLAAFGNGANVAGILKSVYDPIYYTDMYTDSTGLFYLAPVSATTRLTRDAITYADLGITATGVLTITPTSSMMRLQRDVSNYANFSISPTGILAVQPTGGVMRLSYSDSVFTDMETKSTGVFWLTPTGHTLRLAYDAVNYADIDVSATGGLTINTLANTITMHSTDRVLIANIANTTGPGTGALQVDGGIYMAKDMRCDKGFANEFSSNDYLVTGTNPYVNSPSTTDPLTIWSGNTPFTSASGAGIVLRPGMVTGHLDYFAGRNCLHRFYTGTAATLDLAMLLGPANLDVGIAILSRFYNTTQATSPTVASVRMDGGLGVVKDIRCGGTIYAAAFSGPFTPTVPFVLTGGTPQLTLKDTGGAQTDIGTLATGELTITTSLNKEVRLLANTPLRVLNTSAASSSTTGAIVTSGGIGCAGNLYSGAVVYGTRSQFTDAQDQVTLVNSASADIGRISEDTTGNLNLRTTSGKEVLVPSINPVHFYSTHATNALTVNGGITAASIQFNPVRGKYIDLLPSMVPHPVTPPVVRQFGARVQWSCAASVNSILCCSMIFPEDIVPNTQLAFGLHWFAEEPPAGGSVRLGISTQIMSGGGSVLTTPFTTNLYTVAIASNLIQIDTFLQAPTPSNMTPNAPSTVYVFFERFGTDVNDTYAGHIHIMGLSCRYTGSGYGATW